MPLHLDLEQSDKLWLHEFIIVRNVEAHKARLIHRPFVFFLELGPVSSFHHKNGVCPGNQLVRKRIFRIIIRSGRAYFMPRPVTENLLRSRAAKAVLAADEKIAPK